MIRTLSIFAAVALAANASLAQAADNWPTKPVRLLVPVPAGSSADASARVLADRLSPRLGQPVVVENRPGASGNIAAEAVVRATPDGYTVGVFSTSTLAVAPHLNPDLAFDLRKDIKPVSMIGGAPYVLVIHPSLAAKNVQEFVALAKSKPGHINYGTAGVTSLAFLATSDFAQRTGIDLMHIPYKSSGQTVSDMLSGRLLSQFATVAVAQSSIQSEKLRALAVTGRERLPLLPEVPTVMEAGVPNFEATLWLALAMPAGTPDAIVNRFNREVNAVLTSPDGRSALEKLGQTPEPGPPQAVTARIESEFARWGSVAERAGIKKTR